MLNYFRHYSLRKSLWLIVLFGSLLSHTQNLFACELMDNGPQTTCCCDKDMSNGCPMGGGCEISDIGIATGCCDVSTDISIGLSDVTATNSHHYKHFLTLDIAQPSHAMDLIIPSADISNKLAVIQSSLSIPLSGTYTYLITHRFRI